MNIFHKSNINNDVFISHIDKKNKKYIEYGPLAQSPRAQLLIYRSRDPRPLDPILCARKLVPADHCTPLFRAYCAQLSGLDPLPVAPGPTPYAWGARSSVLGPFLLIPETKMVCRSTKRQACSTPLPQPVLKHHRFQ